MPAAMASFAVPHDLSSYRATFSLYCDAAKTSSASAGNTLEDWCKRSLSSAWGLQEFPHKEMLSMMEQVMEAINGDEKKSPGTLQTILDKLAARLGFLASSDHDVSGTSREPQCFRSTQMKILVFWVCQLLQSLSKVHKLPRTRSDCAGRQFSAASRTQP
jgi:hypothetical protein